MNSTRLSNFIISTKQAIVTSTTRRSASLIIADCRFNHQVLQGFSNIYFHMVLPSATDHIQSVTSSLLQPPHIEPWSGIRFRPQQRHFEKLTTVEILITSTL